MIFPKGDYGKCEGFLHPLKRMPILFDAVHIDRLTSFMRSIRKNSNLLVSVDDFPKFVFAKLTRTLKTTETVAKSGEIFGEYG